MSMSGWNNSFSLTAIDARIVLRMAIGVPLSHTAAPRILHRADKEEICVAGCAPNGQSREGSRSIVFLACNL
jgi:hypothetical protein